MIKYLEQRGVDMEPVAGDVNGHGELEEEDEGVVEEEEGAEAGDDAGADESEDEGKTTTSPDADTVILFTKPPGTSNLGKI